MIPPFPCVLVSFWKIRRPYFHYSQKLSANKAKGESRSSPKSLSPLSSFVFFSLTPPYSSFFQPYTPSNAALLCAFFRRSQTVLALREGNNRSPHTVSRSFTSHFLRFSFFFSAFWRARVHRHPNTHSHCQKTVGCGMRKGCISSYFFGEAALVCGGEGSSVPVTQDTHTSLFFIPVLLRLLPMTTSLSHFLRFSLLSLRHIFFNPFGVE